MPERYPVPAARQRSEEIIQRSRFITAVGYAPTVEAARAFIASVRAEFPDATHHCWAYLVGPPGSTSQIGYSDDGEPHGTAGKPMFTVLQHCELGDIVVVVTRYFGGTKLGTGGLVRAYSGGVQLALAGLPTRKHVELAQLLIEIDYAAVTPAQRLLPDFDAEVIDEHYAVAATLHVQLPAASVDSLRLALAELTNGRAVITAAAQSR